MSVIIFTAVLGLIIGSFLNVVIYRLPLMLLSHPAKKINLIYPFSHCPHCQHAIRWWQNIPLISFAILKAKCAYCNKKISWRYPIVEMFMALTSVVVVIALGPTWQAAAGIFLTAALISLIFIDLEHQLLPDEITLSLLWLGLIANAMNLFVSPADAIIGAAAGYIVLWLVAKSFKWLRGIEGMGYGDFKLLAMLGAWFGWQALLFAILFSSLIGSIVGISLILLKKKKFSEQIAFGPYLAFAGWLVLLFQSEIEIFYRLF